MLKTPPLRMTLWGSLLAGIILSGCSGFGKEVDKTRSWSAQRLYSEAKASMNAGDFEQAVDYYQKLEARYPFGKLAEQAQVDVIYAYYKDKQDVSAIAAADRFIKLHPRSPSLDYIYYMKGLTNFNRGRTLLDRVLPKPKADLDQASAQQAFDDFQELTKRFPNSKYYKDSRQRMLYLRNVLAEHEVHVAEFYMRKEAYVAAVNRATYVIENYQRTPSVPEALVIAARAYSKLNMPDLAADTVRVLKLNYPNNPAISEFE